MSSDSAGPPTREDEGTPSQHRVLAGRYRVESLIGRGGMANVFHGTDLTLGREVAIKILHRDLASDNTFRTRFRLEAQAASRMAHPSIVRVYDAGEEIESDQSGPHHVPFIVMELVRGTLLKDVIAAGPVPAEDAVRYVDGILEALEYSHRAGVVHRDIKPANIMITASGQVKVMDFGIARAASDSSSTVAETTAVLGTAAYFSPEQAKGEAVDARADIYSTGIVLYELLTGRPPFRGESPVAVAYQHVSERPQTPSEVSSSSPKSLDPVVLRALAKDPYQRYPDAASFREALDAGTDGAEPSRRELSSLTDDLYGPSPQQAQETARTLRQLSSDHTTARTQSGPPVAWIWAGVALMAVLLISVLFWVVTIRPLTEIPSSARIVPDVSGMTFERAGEEIAKNDLTLTQTTEASDKVDEGIVIRTEPRIGTSVEPETNIKVYVSTGPATTKMPAVDGIGEQDARAALEGAGLTLGSIVPRNDPSLEAGTVIMAKVDNEQIAADAMLPEGSTVNLEVATGRVTLGDYRHWSLDDAVAELERLELVPETREGKDCDTDGVVSQSVVSEAPIHSTVELVYCEG